MGEVPLCTLRDCLASYPDNGAPTAIPGDMNTAAELASHLRAAAVGTPRQFNMDLQGNVRVVLWLGGPWAAIAWCHLHFGPLPPPPSHPSPWRVRAKHPPPVEYVSFLLATRETDIQAEWLLPADEVIRMAVYIAEHRTLPPWGVWVDDDGNQYAGESESRCGADRAHDAVPF
ncbi:MAG TPA: hypothetical protein VFE62_07600 [Gemmataceae bacterium]|nr:hypothetical protein [Gemmataceae bacterium]